MNDENELRSKLESSDSDIVVKATIDLCEEFLIPSSELIEAENLLLKSIGIQSKQIGFRVELQLGRLYELLGENTRAIRFLRISAESPDAEIQKQANDAIQRLESRS